MRRAKPLVALAVVAAVVGCNLILGNQPGVPFTGDAGNDIVQPSDVASDVPGIACDGGVPDDASTALCPGGVWYVSVASGDDTNSGCSPCAAKASVQAALDAIKTASQNADASPPSLAEVHVCTGTYPEVGLVLDQPASLRGGYDCATWTRPADFGFPTFNANVTTTLVNGDPPLQDATLRVADGAIGAGLVIDGFSITGASVTTNATAAIQLVGAAAPKITDCKILGGTGAPTSSSCAYGSAGIDMRDNASPDITANDIQGGSGSCASNGSIGVIEYLSAGAPHIHGNKINGGSGSGANASIGVAITTSSNPLTEATSSAIEDNTITGGTGLGVAVGSVGVLLFDDTTTIDLLGNTIQAGNGAATTNDFNAGVYFKAVTTVNVRQNRIAGGGAISFPDGGATPTFTVPSSYAMYIVDTPTTVTDNFIHGGYSALNTDAIIAQTSDVTIAYNTILTGGAAPGLVSSGIYILEGAVAVRGNLLVGWAESASPAIYDAQMCGNGSADAITDLTDNAFVDNGAGVLKYFSCGSDTSTLASAESILDSAPDPSTTASGNVTLLATCTEARCFLTPGCTLVAGSDAACLANVFTSYTAADVGLTELLTTGYLLRPTAHCEVTKGGEASNALVPLDFFGTARTSPLSIGAVEQNSATCVP